MRVLVTGGSGFTGGYVIPRLVGAGHEVVALARSDRAAARVEQLGATPLPGDLDDPASIDSAFAASGADVLVNLASLGFGHAPLVIAAADDAGIRRAVFVSTTAIFTTLDAASKGPRVAAEEAIRASSLAWTIIRPTMIYGAPGDRNMWRLLQFLRRSPVVPLPDGGRRLQQPVHVDDLAAAIVAAVDTDVAIGRCYDVAGPTPLTFRELIEQAARACGRSPKVVSVPAAPAVAALKVLERTGRAAPIKAEQIQRLLEDKTFDISPARNDLRYEARAFVVGIRTEAAERRRYRHTLAEKPGLYARTITHIPASQLAHRVRLRTKKALLDKWPAPFERRWRRRETAISHWPIEFEAIDLRLAHGCPSPEANAAGVFEFLNHRRDLGQPVDWRPDGVPQLWRYCLHYWEWLWPFAAQADRAWARSAFATLWRSWKAGTVFARWDEWSPYVVSIRAWVMCNAFDALVSGSDLEQEFVDDLALHARFVRANLEVDVGGNHLIKNLKALVGLGVFLGQAGTVAAACRRLDEQLSVQILADGGHYERSPSYHCQVLGDLIDVRDLLVAARHVLPARLEPSIAAMQQWLGAMLMPDGDVPLFNDCVLVGEDRVKILDPAPSAGSLVVLEPSGYVVARLGDRVHLVADVGPPCPPELPAHAHAGCLSFELAVDGQRVVVDTGTSTYEPGSRRAFERSTAAHNTVEVDGLDQTEVWGTFRAGRRADATLEEAVEAGGEIRIVGSHRGYRHLAGQPLHRRTWRVRSDGVRVLDEVDGEGRHTVVARLTLSDGAAAAVDVASDTPAHEEPAVIATAFGRTSAATRLSWTIEGHLPARMETTIAVRSAGGVA